MESATLCYGSNNRIADLPIGQLLTLQDQIRWPSTSEFVQPQIAFNDVLDTTKGISTFLNPHTGN